MVGEVLTLLSIDVGELWNQKIRSRIVQNATKQDETKEMPAEGCVSKEIHRNFQ